MEIRWFGQSAFVLTGERTVVIDPFAMPAGSSAARGLRFDYPAIEPRPADVLLITHEHADHNGAGVVTGDPATVRSTAGTFDSPVGEVTAVASEHDDAAGTKRGPNTIFRFALDGLRVCHFGDFGQAALRPEQREAIGAVDVLFLPVGGGPTVGGEQAAAVARALEPRLVVPMHHRTEAVNFLDPPDAFLDALGAPVTRLDRPAFEAADHLGAAGAPAVVLPAVILR